MTAILDTDPLAANLLPSRPDMTVSTDAPSGEAARPFGLTRLATLGDNEGVVTYDGISYDPERQVNVTPDGQPVVDAPGVIHMATHQDTQYDMTWVVDRD